MRWFGPGKKSAIISIAAIAVLLISITTAVVLIATNVGGKTSISQPNAPPVAPNPIAPAGPPILVPGTTPIKPAAPTPTPKPTPNQTPPVATNEPTPAGVIKITAKKLASELAVDHFKYKRGTVFQVSGTFKWQKEYFPNTAGDVSFFLGPAVSTKDYPLGVIIRVDMEKESKLFKAFTALGGDREVVVQGTYFTFNNSYMQGVILENVSLISVTPK